VLKSLLCASLFLLFFAGSLRASTIGLTAAAGYLSSDCGPNVEHAGSTPVTSSTLTSSAQLPCDYSFYQSYSDGSDGAASVGNGGRFAEKAPAASQRVS
jgi:hypothetical protein